MSNDLQLSDFSENIQKGFKEYDLNKGWVTTDDGNKIFIGGDGKPAYTRDQIKDAQKKEGSSSKETSSEKPKSEEKENKGSGKSSKETSDHFENYAKNNPLGSLEYEMYRNEDISKEEKIKFISGLREKYGAKNKSGKDKALKTLLKDFQEDVKSDNLSNVKLSSEDQSRVSKYENEIKSLESQRDQNTAINKLIRNKDVEGSDKKLKEMGLSESAINSLRNPQYGRAGVSSFVNQNISGNIKNKKDMVEKIKRNAKLNQEATDGSSGGIKQGDTGVHGIEFENNQDDQRVRLTFDGKPNAETRSTLKRNGFKWSPKNSAWQRNNNEAGHGAVKRALESLKDKESIY